MSFEAPPSIPLPHEDKGQTEHQTTTGGSSTQIKPIRLALACNQCRKRKVRCDAQQPSCRNCSIRGDICETSDPRKPGNLPAVRRRATRCCQKGRGEAGKCFSPARRSLNTLTPAAVSSINSVLNPTGPSPDTSVGHTLPDVRRDSRSSAIPGSSESPATASWRTTQSERLGEDHFSWQSRAYQDCAEDQGQDVVQEHDAPEQEVILTPDETVTTDDGTNNRTKHLGASSVQCLFNFVDLHLARHGFSHATPLFKHGMLHTEEFPMPLIPKLPLLPDRQTLSIYVDAFFSRLYPIYPVIDRASFEADIEAVLVLQAAGPTAWQDKVTLSHIPVLASVYAVISLSMNEISGNSELGFDYLAASHGIHGHLTAIPYMPSVQALFLLSLALRAIAKDGQAWHIIGQAIRMAQSIGLYKSAAQHPSEDGFTLGYQPESLRERLWWSLFGLEKLMQLECGRPSIIDRSYDCLTVDYPSASSKHSPCFRAWIALSSIMGKISSRLYSHKFMGGSAEMLGAVAKLDQELLEWESALPDTLKPRALTDNTGHDHQTLAMFLSQQFYHAQLSILRVTVIFPHRSIKREVEKNITILPTHTRLLDGPLICAHAARTLITQSLQLADRDQTSTLLSVSPTYLAAVILALGVLRQPNSRLVRSDIELLSSATEYVEGWYLARGFSSAFTQTCMHLRERVVSVFQRAGSTSQEGIASASVGSLADSGCEVGDALVQIIPGSRDQSVFSAGIVRSSHGGSAPNVVDQGVDLFGDFDFEDLWNMTGLDFMVYDQENPVFT